MSDRLLHGLQFGSCYCLCGRITTTGLHNSCGHDRESFASVSDSRVSVDLCTDDVVLSAQSLPQVVRYKTVLFQRDEHPENVSAVSFNVI